MPALVKMSVDNFSLKLSRTIGQVRIRPTLTSLENRPEVAKRLEDRYENWSAKDGNITLSTESEKKLFEVHNQNITYLKEGGREDLDELKNYIKKIFEGVNKSSDVREVRRVGFRRTQVFESNFEFHELLDLLYEKLYSQEEKFKSISDPSDLAFILNGNKNGLLHNVIIGPVKKDEGIAKFRSAFNPEKLDSDSNLFIDLDVFSIKGLGISNALAQLDAAIEENSRILGEYLAYIAS